MNNSKNTEKQKNDGAKKVDLLKNMSDCKKEAEGLNASIKKCLSLALGLKSQLKQKLEKINASALEEQQKQEEKRKEEERLKAEQIKKEEEKKIKEEKEQKQDKPAKPQGKQFQPLPKFGKPFEQNVRTRHFNEGGQENAGRHR